MCRGAVGSDLQQGWNLTQGMGYSIYFMLSMPFLVLGGFAGLLYWKVRKARRLEQSETEQKSE